MSKAHSDLEALQLALKIEEDGRKFFLEASHKTKNTFAKETFSSLADWELEHISIIKKYHQRLQETGEWGSIGELSEKKSPVIATMKTIFAKAKENLDETVKVDADVIQAYKVAKDIEDKAVKFYKDLVGKTTDKNAKGFYNFMLGQEREHYRILDNSHRYMQDPKLWYQEEESWMFDGG